MVGIDTSITSTGLAIAELNYDYKIIKQTFYTFGTSSKFEVPGNRRFRYECVANEVIDRIEAAIKPYICKSLKVFIAFEHYIMGGHGRGYTLAELHGFVKAKLISELLEGRYSIDHTIIEVPPTTLKQFATGSGKADKDDMKAAARAIGVDFDDDNQCDAFWLSQFALAFTDPDLRYRSSLYADKINWF